MTSYEMMLALYNAIADTELALADFRLKCLTIGLTEAEIAQIVGAGK